MVLIPKNLIGPPTPNVCLSKSHVRRNDGE